MAETQLQPPESSPDPESFHYWCYHCDKQVSVETLPNLPDLSCHECKNGFVEAIVTTTTPPLSTNLIEEPSFNHQFLQGHQLMSQSSHDDEAPPPQYLDPVSEPSDIHDFLQIELHGWNNIDENVEFVNNDGDRSENEIGDVEEDEDEEEHQRRSRREFIRLQIGDLISHARGRDWILELSETLMRLEDDRTELHLQMSGSDRYMGNPEDFVNSDGFEVFLQNLENVGVGGMLGAPPAARSAVEGLQTVEISPEEDDLICSICKDSVQIEEKAKELPCGHGYHEDCIMPWLGSRNTCPVCRFELPTDDLEYEEERRKRAASMATSGTSGAANSGGNNPDSD